MAITVACSCGQKFAARDQLAGKTVKCPKCSQPLKIPGGPAAASAKATPPAKDQPAKAKKPAPANSHDEVFDEIGLTHRGEGTECPSCGAMLPENAVLCIHCGYNFKLKRRMQTLGSSTPMQANEPATPGKKMSEVEKMLVRAEDDLEDEPIEQNRGYGTAASAWILFLIMAVIAGGVIAGGVLFFNYMEGEPAEEEQTSSQTAS